MLMAHAAKLVKITKSHRQTHVEGWCLDTIDDSTINIIIMIMIIMIIDFLFFYLFIIIIIIIFF